MDSTAVHGGINRRATPKRKLALICALYLLLSVIFGSVNLDVDEFGFIKEPYEMVGGDYTKRYLAQGDFARAASTAGKAQVAVQRVLERRDRAECERRHERHRHGERQDDRMNGDLLEARQRARPNRDEQLEPGVREHQAERAADGADDEALDE